MAELHERDILGVPVLAIDGSEAMARIAHTIETDGHERYAFLNAHGANLASDDESFRDLLRTFQVLPDGAGVDIASTWLYGERFPQNLNGTDFVPELLRQARRPWSVGLWGAAPGVADLAVVAWQAAFPGHAFRAIADGYVGPAERDAALGRLEDRPSDILLIAMGNPRQERFIAEHLDARHARVAIGVGALFDFAAGRVRRAPGIMRRLRVEWAFRLAQEPERLAGRYLVGNPLFLARVGRQKRLRHG